MFFLLITHHFFSSRSFHATVPSPPRIGFNLFVCRGGRHAGRCTPPLLRRGMADIGSTRADIDALTTTIGATEAKLNGLENRLMNASGEQLEVLKVLVASASATLAHHRSRQLLLEGKLVAQGAPPPWASNATCPPPHPHTPLHTPARNRWSSPAVALPLVRGFASPNGQSAVNPKPLNPNLAPAFPGLRYIYIVTQYILNALYNHRDVYIMPARRRAVPVPSVGGAHTAVYERAIPPKQAARNRLPHRSPLLIARFTAAG